MTFLACCQYVRDHGLCLIRAQENYPGQYELCEPFENGRGWVWLDATTANIVCQVYEVLSPARQEKFKDLPASMIMDLCWRVINGT